MKNINNESWLKNLNSTGGNSPYYTWTTENFSIQGERPDIRCKILDNYPHLFFRKKVVDIGCNLGRISHHAIALGAELVYGVEQDKNTYIAAKRLRDLQNLSEKINFFNMSLAKEVPKIKVNTAICFSVLHHINPRDMVWDFLNNNVSDYVIVESKINESPHQSSYEEGDFWVFQSDSDMISYILKKLSNFSYSSQIGISERNRPILLFKKND